MTRSSSKYFTGEEQMVAPPNSIPIRFDVKGNSAVVSWSPSRVLEEWKTKHLYEIAFTSDDDLAILFGDIDVKATENFDKLNDQYKDAIVEFLGGHQFALASASCSKTGKISWRFYVPDMVGTASAQKEWAENVNKQEGLKLPDGTPITLDLAVYHKGRKMRMLHAWKQVKDEEGNLIDDVARWEKRPLKLVLGDENDTMLHRISENAEQMPSAKKKVLAYDDFNIIRRLVLECLTDARAKEYITWRNTIWAIKSVESTARALELAHDFSKKANYNAKAVEKTWREGKDKITSGSIHYWARNDNPVKYADIVARVPVEFLEKNINEGDIGLARIFAKVYEDIVVSVPSTRRCYWGYDYLTGLWSEHKDDYIITLFTSNMRSILTPLAIKLTNDLKDIQDSDEGKALRKKINNVLVLISSMCMTKTATKCLSQISVVMNVGEEWTLCLNSKRDLLPVANGVLELRTGILRPYEMDDYFTNKLAVSYTEAPTDKQERFFNDVLHGEQDAIDYTQFFLGYSLTGETSLQKALILEGSEDGANAKSVLMECMLSVLGKTYYSTLNRKAMALTDGQNNDSLYGARFSRVVCVPEMNKNGNNLDEGLIKNITGDDEIDVSAKFKSNITFHPQFKVFMPLNEMFPIPANSGAVWRRLIVMPFKVRFLSIDNPDWDDELAEQKWIIKRDDKFAKDLKADKEGWLNWLVKGAIKYYANPEQEPPACLQKHLIQKQMENDTYLSFINNNYIITNNREDYIPVRDFASVFPNPEHDKEKAVERRISSAMKKLGVEKNTKDVHPIKRENLYDDKSGRWLWKNIEDTTLPAVKTKVWYGIRIKTDEEKEA